MMHLDTFRSTVLTLCITALAPVQAQMNAAWTADTGPVQWMRTTSAGALVVGTAEALKGVDPANGAVLWSLKELGGAPVANYAEVERSPYITVVPAGRPEALFIVEPFTGQVVFNSEATGLSNIASKYFLYANEAIILVGQKADKQASMVCVDMASGKVRWTKDDAFSRLTACNSAGPDAMLICTLFFVYKLDAASGEELWKRGPDPAQDKMAGLSSMLDKGGANLALPGVYGVFVTTPHAPELCFMGMQTEHRKETTDSQGKKTVTVTYKTFVNAFRIADGAYAWSAPLQMQQKLGAIVPLKQGLLVGAGDNRSVDMLDYASGAGRWGKNGKGINVKGILAGAVEMDDHVLLTSGGEDGVVTMVDASGNEVWKKAVKLDGAVRSVARMGGDLLVATEQEVDLIDRATGISRLEKPLKGGAGLVATGNEVTYVFNTKDGLLYVVQSSGGSAKPLGGSPVTFEGKEKPTALEHTPDGLVLSSDQNLALLGTDGSVKYRKYFPAPRESGLVRALKYASAVRAAYYTAAFGYTSAAFGAAGQNIQVNDAQSAMAKELAGGLSQVYGEGAQVAAGATKRFWQEAGARFKATTSTNALHFMLTEAGKGAYTLKALRKADGTDAVDVPLGREREPQYEVDGFTNAVYLAEGSSVKCFRP